MITPQIGCCAAAAGDHGTVIWFVDTDAALLGVWFSSVLVFMFGSGLGSGYFGLLVQTRQSDLQTPEQLRLIPLALTLYLS